MILVNLGLKNAYQTLRGLLEADMILVNLGLKRLPDIKGLT